MVIGKVKTHAWGPVDDYDVCTKNGEKEGQSGAPDITEGCKGEGYYNITWFIRANIDNNPWYNSYQMS